MQYKEGSADASRHTVSRFRKPSYTSAVPPSFIGEYFAHYQYLRVALLYITYGRDYGSRYHTIRIPEEVVSDKMQRYVRTKPSKITRRTHRVSRAPCQRHTVRRSIFQLPKKKKNQVVRALDWWKKRNAIHETSSRTIVREHMAVIIIGGISYIRQRDVFREVLVGARVGA